MRSSISRFAVSLILLTSISTFAQTVHKNILVETFQGHRCGNCGSMDYAVEQKHDQYGDSVVFVSIHPDTPFNEPIIGGPAFITDFRIEEGEQIRVEFGIPSSLPRAMISRNESVPSFFMFNANQIDAEVDARIGVAAKFDMNCTAYMNPSREIVSEVTVTDLDTVLGAYKLINYIVEDSVIDWQVVYPGQHPSYTGAIDDAYPNYAHRYVLRDVNRHIGVLEGAPIYTGDLYGYQLPYPMGLGTSVVVVETSHPMPIGWNENKISVVSFIIDTLNQEVMQVINTPVDINVSANEITTVDLAIYPNPANDLTFVRLSHRLSDARLKVINMSGALVIDQLMNSEQVAIDVSSLTPGIYSIIIQHMNGVVSKRLVVE